MSIYNLIEYKDNHSKTSGSLWQHYRDEPFLDAYGTIADFPDDDNNSAQFKCKTKTEGRTENDGTQNIKSMVPLNYFSNF